MISERQLNNTTASRAAFTLVELLVVMLVIAILSSIMLGVTRFATWKSQEVKSGIERLKIQTALEEYRAVYGEYPILGDPNHYPDADDNYNPDPDTSDNLPERFRTVNLIDNLGPTNTMNVNTRGAAGWAKEYLPFTSAWGQSQNEIMIDYSLTYPLMVRPQKDGRKAFMIFPKMTVCSLVWRNATLWNSTYVGTNRYYIGEDEQDYIEKTYKRGDPVNRYVAIVPGSSCKQWTYACSDGTTYQLY